MNGIAISKFVGFFAVSKFLGNLYLSEQIFNRKRSLGAPDTINSFQQPGSPKTRNIRCHQDNLAFSNFTAFCFLVTAHQMRGNIQVSKMNSESKPWDPTSLQDKHSVCKISCKEQRNGIEGILKKLSFSK